MVIIAVSVSGGWTSAYMAYMLKKRKAEVAAYFGVDESEVVFLFTFANTGLEHDDTLRFMRDVSRYLLDDAVVWVEGVVPHGLKKSTTHRVVDYDTAFRADQWSDPRHPFHAYISKYGIPNVRFKSCTRELKLRTINSYLNSITGDLEFYTAIGIREDETRRVSKSAGVDRIFYPLVDIFPTDKDEVLDRFAQFEWDLAIPEWLGNCVTCYKKSFKKLKAVHAENPEFYEFNREMERRYAYVGAEFRKHNATKPRTFFRLGTSTDKLIEAFGMGDENPEKYINVMNDAGCSESCEMYEMADGTEYPDAKLTPVFTGLVGAEG